MSELSATLYFYHLPLRHPLAVRGGASNERRGVLLRLATEDGAVGWGDAAPLPGWSHESLDRAALDLRMLVANLPTGSLDAQWILQNEYATEGVCPSARFAFECAFLGLLAAQGRVSLRTILADDPVDCITINGLVTRDHPAPPEGYPAYKVKVGSQDPDEESAWIRRLADALPEGVQLRLDANRSWTVDEAIQFTKGVADCPVEYLEEPLRDVGQLSAFADGSPVPIAIDETLHERGVEFLDQCPGLRAVVMKPALNGGVVDALRIAEAARQRGPYVVVSSGFESGIGIRALAQLAGAIVPAGVTCGLDPYRWIAEDVVEPELEMAGGILDLAQIDRTVSTVCMKNLQELKNG